MTRQLAPLLGLAGLGFVAFAPGAAKARRVVLPCVKDTTLHGPFGGQISNGSGTRCFAGSTQRFGVRRALFLFAVTDSIPARAHVDSVEFVLQCDRTTSGAHAMELHRLGRAWGEAGSASTGGGGDIARAGDATWTHAIYDVTLWNTPGGDFARAVSATTMVDQPGAYRWRSTLQFVADVQGWVDAPSTNFGWILIGDETSHSAKRFHTRESEITAMRPALIVDYTPPVRIEPTTWSAVKRLYMSEPTGVRR